MRESWRGGAWIAKGRGEAGILGILVQRQVMPMWADDPIWRHERRWWRGCLGRRGLPPPKDIRRRKGRAGWDKNKYITISDRA